jgi:hypothetical protein
MVGGPPWVPGAPNPTSHSSRESGPGGASLGAHTPSTHLPEAQVESSLQTFAQLVFVSAELWGDAQLVATPSK